MSLLTEDANYYALASLSLLNGWVSSITQK